eukprot:2811218-Prymnesium_polylepis.2
MASAALPVPLTTTVGTSDCARAWVRVGWRALVDVLHIWMCVTPRATHRRQVDNAGEAARPTLDEQTDDGDALPPGVLALDFESHLLLAAPRHLARGGGLAVVDEKVVRVVLLERRSCRPRLPACVGHRTTGQPVQVAAPQHAAVRRHADEGHLEID